MKVKRWVKRTGINKHISWHCARHSFAVNILNNGANIKTVASLLGHSGLKHTEIYRLTPEERYKELLERCPDILQLISLKEVAYYLKITPVHMSRIRRKITFLE